MTLLPHEALLGIDHPIIQAPMAGIAPPALAAAVSNAGGLGSLAVGAVGPDEAARMIGELRGLTSRHFNVNVFTHRPPHTDHAVEQRWIETLEPWFEGFEASPPTALQEIYRSFVEDDAMLALLISQKPAVVSFHFGLPDGERIKALREAGITLMATATNVVEAQAAAAAGVHAIVAQGYEAGGHRGMFDPDAEDEQLDTLALVRKLVREAILPVIAAGGIMNGAGIREALEQGAIAAQLGTAYVLTDESLADVAFRAAMLDPAAQRTVMTRAISGRPARSLVNDFTELGQGVPDHAIPPYPIAYDAGKAVHRAARTAGVSGYGAQWAGQGARLARRMSAGLFTQTLAREIA